MNTERLGCAQHARAVVEPHRHSVGSQSHTENKSSVQLFTENAAKTSDQLFNNVDSGVQIPAPRFYGTDDLQPPSRHLRHRNMLQSIKNAKDIPLHLLLNASVHCIILIRSLGLQEMRQQRARNTIKCLPCLQSRFF